MTANNLFDGQILYDDLYFQYRAARKGNGYPEAGSDARRDETGNRSGHRVSYLPESQIRFKRDSQGLLSALPAYHRPGIEE